MKDIDRIEGIRGPGGTIWGPNAVNGVMNIITKSTKETQGVLGSGGGGGVEQFIGDARYGSGNGRGFTYRVYAKGFGWAPQYHSTAITRRLAGGSGGIPHGLGGAAGIVIVWRAILWPILWRENRRFNLQPAGQLHKSGDATLYGGNILFNWTRVQGEGETFSWLLIMPTTRAMS